MREKREPWRLLKQLVIHEICWPLILVLIKYDWMGKLYTQVTVESALLNFDGISISYCILYVNLNRLKYTLGIEITFLSTHM